VSERPIHDRLEELFAADAMDGLDDDGRHELRELLTWHDSQCPDCARFRREYREIAAAMALSLQPMPLSAGAEERLLTAARTTTQGRPTHGGGVVTREVVELDEAREERERRRSPAKVAVALLAAAACLVGAGVIGYVLRAPSTSPEAVVAAYRSQGPTQQATMQDGSKKVTLYYHPGQPQALVVGSGMADPPAGHVYELWYLPEGQTDMAPGGIFVPSDGDVVAPATVQTPFTTVAVSIETGYHTAPTGEVVLSENVST
jgi:Anti-sigma-K factor rskA, C-terminal